MPLSDFREPDQAGGEIWWEDGYEDELRASFTDDCPERQIVSLTTSFARALIDDSPGFVSPGPVDHPSYLLLAAQLSTTRMLRAARAATAVMSVGYEPEARAVIRIMVELAAHTEYWIADSTSARAREWLNGEHEYGVTAKVAEILDRGIYKELCIDAHGDPRSLLTVLDPKEQSISMGPDRTINSRVYLLVIADAVVESCRVLASQYDSNSEEHFRLLDERRAALWEQLRVDRGDSAGNQETPELT